MLFLTNLVHGSRLGHRRGEGAWLISFIKPDRDIKSWGGVAYNIYEFRLEQTRGEGTWAKALHNAWWLATRSLSHTEFVVCTSTETGWLARICVNAFIWAVLIPSVNTELQSLIISDSIYSCWNCFALQLDNRGYVGQPIGHIENIIRTNYWGFVTLVSFGIIL